MNKPFNTVPAAGNLICDHAHLVRAYLAAAECFGRGTPERDALERVAGTIRLALSYAAHVMGAEETAVRALGAAHEADAAERELAHANPFQADEEAWTNERALQEAQTEKEARHA